MNEFIVFDEVEKKFYNEKYIEDGIEKKFVLTSYGKVLQHSYYNEYEEDLLYPYIEQEKLKAFMYIGKTDDTPKKNKIYADCSIVELDFYREVSRDGEYSYEPKRIKGYFSYVENEMRYKFIELTDKYYKVITEFNELYIKNIKVIGTLLLKT